MYNFVKDVCRLIPHVEVSRHVNRYIAPSGEEKISPIMNLGLIETLDWPKFVSHVVFRKLGLHGKLYGMPCLQVSQAVTPFYG